MNFSTFRRRIILTIALGCIGFNCPAFADKKTQILIISNSNEAAYQEAIKGFKAQLPAGAGTQYTEIALSGLKSGQQTLAVINPDLIYALGSESTLWASQQTTTLPIVATLVLKDDELKKSANLTGVALTFSIKTQFQWLKKFFDPKKTVAILYNPAENENMVKEAKAASSQNDFKFEAIAVESPKELPYALARLANNVDVLLSIPDETVMSANTAKEVLLASFSNKVPLVGLSENWVKSGAFYALSWDYNDLGKQCAEMAKKILNGSRISALTPENPRKITYTINTKIAEHMNIDIPPDTLKNATKIY